MSRRLAQRHVRDVLGEEQPRRFGDAVDGERAALAERHVVQVQLEDLVLGQPALEDERHELILQLAQRACVRRREERVLDQLLRERAAAAQVGSLAGQVFPERRTRCRSDRRRVVVEAAVLDREDRLHHVLRDELQRHVAPFLAPPVMSAVMSGASNVSTSMRALPPDELDVMRSPSSPSRLGGSDAERRTRIVWPLRSPFARHDERARPGPTVNSPACRRAPGGARSQARSAGRSAARGVTRLAPADLERPREDPRIDRWTSRRGCAHRSCGSKRRSSSRAPPRGRRRGPRARRARRASSASRGASGDAGAQVCVERQLWPRQRYRLNRSAGLPRLTIQRS